MPDEPTQPPRNAKAFAVKIDMSLVIVAERQEDITPAMIFNIALKQYNFVNPKLEKEFVGIKRIITTEDIPAGWRHALPWNTEDDFFPASYIPSPLGLLAEQAEDDG